MVTGPRTQNPVPTGPRWASARSSAAASPRPTEGPALLSVYGCGSSLLRGRQGQAWGPFPACQGLCVPLLWGSSPVPKENHTGQEPGWGGAWSTSSPGHAHLAACTADLLSAAPTEPGPRAAGTLTESRRHAGPFSSRCFSCTGAAPPPAASGSPAPWRPCSPREDYRYICGEWRVSTGSRSRMPPSPSPRLPVYARDRKANPGGRVQAEVARKRHSGRAGICHAHICSPRTPKPLPTDTPLTRDYVAHRGQEEETTHWGPPARWWQNLGLQLFPGRSPAKAQASSLSDATLPSSPEPAPPSHTRDAPPASSSSSASSCTSCWGSACAEAAGS